ncbi:MAG: hypothetical protein WDW38_005462 [Sanguina aurantia]
MAVNPACPRALPPGRQGPTSLPHTHHPTLGPPQYLIKKRVDVDAGDNFRVAAIHLAAIENHQAVVELLLNARGDVCPADNEGDQPLHWAATKGHTEVMDLLLRHAHPINSANKRGWTALHRASYNGRTAAVHLLMKGGAASSAANVDGNTPLHLAAYMNQLGVMEKLCELGCKIDGRNRAGRSAHDLCITDAGREILVNYGWLYVGTGEPAVQVAPALMGYSEGDELIKRTSRHSAAPNFMNIQSGAKPKMMDDACEDGFPNMDPTAPGRVPAGPPTFNDPTFAMHVLAGMAENPYERFLSGVASKLSGATSSTANVNTNTSTTIASSRASLLMARLPPHPPPNSASNPNSNSNSNASSNRPSPAPHAPSARNPSPSSLSHPHPPAAANPPLSGPLNPRLQGLGSKLLKPIRLGTSMAPPSTTSTTNTTSSATGGGGSLGGGGAGVNTHSPRSLSDGRRGGGFRGRVGVWGRAPGGDYQSGIKEENRGARTPAGVSNNMGAAAVLGAADAALGLSPGKPRPQSGNAKFLQRYSLGRMNLFGPS